MKSYNTPNVSLFGRKAHQLPKKNVNLSPLNIESLNEQQFYRSNRHQFQEKIYPIETYGGKKNNNSNLRNYISTFFFPPRVISIYIAADYFVFIHKTVVSQSSLKQKV